MFFLILFLRAAHRAPLCDPVLLTATLLALVNAQCLPFKCQLLFTANDIGLEADFVIADFYAQLVRALHALAIQLYRLARWIYIFVNDSDHLGLLHGDVTLCVVTSSGSIVAMPHPSAVQDFSDVIEVKINGMQEKEVKETQDLQACKDKLTGLKTQEKELRAVRWIAAFYSRLLLVEFLLLFSPIFKGGFSICGAVSGTLRHRSGHCAGGKDQRVYNSQSCRKPTNGTFL